MEIRQVSVALVVLQVALFLQGCWWSPGTAASCSQVFSSAQGWKLNPIEVKGQYLYDSVTGKSFHAKGIGFPVGLSTVAQWIEALQNINKLSPDINLIRVYEVPECVWNTTCIEPFMEWADKLGIYVLAPGAGTSWGYYPAPGSCNTANECYLQGGLLGWGQMILQAFNYPNTLGIVIGNEFDMQSPQLMPVIKAYARDLKSYMGMCNTNHESLSCGKMRAIPLLYANSDAGGNPDDKVKADYLFCGESKNSIDIFGLNIERYCGSGGKSEYDGVNTWVSNARYPGAFMFSEMGCSKTAFPNSTRDWNQVPGFFESFSAVNGFAAYTYYGNPDFNMFDGPTATATIYQDGTNFFQKLASTGTEPERSSVTAVTPTCATTMLGKPMDALDSVLYYDTGERGYAMNCPNQPPDSLRQGVARTFV